MRVRYYGIYDEAGRLQRKVMIVFGQDKVMDDIENKTSNVFLTAGEVYRLIKQLKEALDE